MHVIILVCYIFYSLYGGLLKEQNIVLLSCLPKRTDPVADVPWYSGVMPRADTCLSVEKVHLALLRGPLLCKNT